MCFQDDPHQIVAERLKHQWLGEDSCIVLQTHETLAAQQLEEAQPGLRTVSAKQTDPECAKSRDGEIPGQDCDRRANKDERDQS